MLDARDPFLAESARKLTAKLGGMLPRFMVSTGQAIGRLVAEKYRLTRLLGQGGMGAVYESSFRGQRLAVKLMLSPPIAGDMLRRFVRETRVAGTLRDQHLVPVLDSGVDQASGDLFLVMPLIEGEDLGATISKIGPLPPWVATRLLLQAARGVRALHAARVVHRDLKPSNVMVSSSDGRALAQVCDFGIAKDLATPDVVTRTGALLGSPLYMAPEQMANAKHVGPPSDLWSLGATLYELLAGSAPFAGVQSFSELILAAQGDVPHLQDVAPWVAPELATLVHGLMLRDLERRCPSIEALITELEVLAGGDELPVSAIQPLAAAERSRRAVRAERPARFSPLPRPQASPAEDPWLGQVVGGQFRLELALGRGGMGAVYRGVRADGQRVAVKLITGVEHRDVLRRFAREARAVTSIQNEHVVQVLAAEADPAQGPPYIAMELLNGLDLDGLVRQNGALDPVATASLFVGVCRGLAAAHEQNVVHRDVKPANLFLHELPTREIVVKVCDFGIAKESTVTETQDTTLDLTRTGGMLGSPLYMSPEQARNAKYVDHRSDIWGASISLYEALTGHRPWEGCSTVGELILAICTGRITPIQDLAPWVDSELAEIVQRGLDPDPAKRWASAAELLSALEPLASAEPVTRAALVKLSAADRARVAPRRSDAEPTPALTGPERTLPSATLPRRWLRLGLGGAAALALVVGLGFSRYRAGAVVDGPASTPAPASSARLVSAHVSVEPPTVSVVGPASAASVASVPSMPAPAVAAVGSHSARRNAPPERSRPTKTSTAVAAGSAVASPAVAPVPEPPAQPAFKDTL